MPEADQSAAAPDGGTGVEFPWEAPVPELLLTDVVEEPAVAEELAPSRVSETLESAAAASAPEWSGGVESLAVDEPADDFMAGAGIGDYEREQDSGDDGYGGADTAVDRDEIAEPASLPEDAYFITGPLEAATAPDAQTTGEDARELAGELQLLADALRRDGLAALGRAVRGEPRLQALVAAVLSAYTASPSDGD